MYDISTLKFVKIEFLTHTVNFCTESTFSAGLGRVWVRVFYVLNCLLILGTDTEKYYCQIYDLTEQKYSID